MKTPSARPVFRQVLAAFAGIFSGAAPSETQSSATSIPAGRVVGLASGEQGTVVSGQISNAATGSYLEGAAVELIETGRIVLTDREGRYELTGVTGDSAMVGVSFPGLDSQRIPVRIEPGKRTVLDVNLTAEFYQMEKFTVAGVREGKARAETLQRLAPNVKNVVSSDAIGNIADGNVVELLQYVAGVSAAYNGMDARGASIRGVGAGLNSVTMDGQQIAQSASGSAERRFDFDQQSLNNIESIEVILSGAERKLHDLSRANDRWSARHVLMLLCDGHEIGESSVL